MTKSADAIRWQLSKRLSRRTRILKLANGVLFKAYPDCVVSSALVYAEWPEYLELMFLRRWLQKGQILIDVGAYVGHISLLLADIVGAENISAFEPSPLHYRRLVENWQLNHWPTDYLRQAVVGSDSGTAFVENLVSPLTTLAASETPADGRSVLVPMVNLDGVRAQWQGRSIGLVKIDVEGQELDVLAGSSKLLAEDRPGIIMFESLSGFLNPEINALLSRSAYTVFRLDDHGRPDLSRQDAQNLFAVPSEQVRLYSPG